jgi:polyketide cyclase/dehydrase/lipid transport protein
MARIEFDIRTDASAEAVRAALLDFSERRPELWPGLPRDQYEVYEVGDTWAEIREGYRGPIWVRERYDWSVPGSVRFTAVDSGFAKPGSYVVVDIEPAKGGGSTLHITWVRRPKGWFGMLFVSLMVLTRGIAIRRSFEAGLAQISAGPADEEGRDPLRK